MPTTIPEWLTEDPVAKRELPMDRLMKDTGTKVDAAHNWSTPTTWWEGIIITEKDQILLNSIHASLVSFEASMLASLKSMTNSVEDMKNSLQWTWEVNWTNGSRHSLTRRIGWSTDPYDRYQDQAMMASVNSLKARFGGLSHWEREEVWKSKSPYVQ